ncbi:hypothetical protein LCGC14_2219850 [marine sediment metagenome]|uniref:Sialidase domain-containing protein n=1 Tax=marine sediment metagenome TaxID=412755 RepID=A0A0F9DYV3_9ZZZZ
MADVAVETAAQGDSEIWNLRCGPVWIDGDTGYIVFADSANDIRYRKTTDGGANWAASVLIDAGTVRGLDVWFDKWTPGDSGTKIHIWWLETLSDDVHYRSLDTSGDTLGTDITVFDGTTFSNTATRAQMTISGTKAVGGNLYVQFWGASGAGERGFYRSVDNGANWTSRTDGADGDLVDEVLCLPDDDSADNQDIVVVYWDRSADEISLKKYDNSGNSWSETSISGSMADGSMTLQMSAVVRHSDGHIIVAAWSAFDAATADLKVWDITLATPTITAKTDVMTDVNECACVALFIDQNTDDLYVSYLGQDDGGQTFPTDVQAHYQKSSDGGGTWGGETTYQANAVDDERYISAGHSTPGSAAGRYEPVFFNDDLSDLFVNVTNSIELGAAAANTRRYSLTVTGVG